MLGTLPTTLDVCGVNRRIRPDFRNILRIFEAFNSDELDDAEKIRVCLVRMYKDFNKIPKTDYEAAYKAASLFIECNMHDDRPSPRTVNWTKDEQIIFPAINKVAGIEVRSVPFMHWWTFMGYFQSVDRDDLWGFILTIRQKRAKGKKLEKHEREFFTSNKDICSVEDAKSAKTPEEQLKEMFESLIESGD